MMTYTEWAHLKNEEEDWTRVGSYPSDSSEWQTGRGSCRSDKGPKRALSFLSARLFVLQHSVSLLLGVGTWASQSSWFPLVKDPVLACPCIFLQTKQNKRILQSIKNMLISNTHRSSQRFGHTSSISAVMQCPLILKRLNYIKTRHEIKSSQCLLQWQLCTMEVIS